VATGSGPGRGGGVGLNKTIEYNASHYSMMLETLTGIHNEPDSLTVK